MKLKVKSGFIVKSLNAAIDFNVEDNLNLFINEDRLVIYSTNLFFSLPIEEVADVDEGINIRVVNASMLKPVASLTSKTIGEFIDLDFTDDYIEVSSGISFQIMAERTQLEALPQSYYEEELLYQQPEVWKSLSKYLSKFSKDNFKGCFYVQSDALILPGEYQLSFMTGEFPDDKQAYNLKSTALNKLLKLGQDLALLPEGTLASSEEIIYKVCLPKADKLALIATNKDKLDALFEGADFPRLSILQPKIFKDFLKGARSDDKQYDLVSIETEESRIVLSLYKNKIHSNKFI
jgi:hypothetical protein